MSFFIARLEEFTDSCRKSLIRWPRALAGPLFGVHGRLPVSPDYHEPGITRLSRAVVKERFRLQLLPPREASILARL
jgi:hypothetical protein